MCKNVFIGTPGSANNQLYSPDGIARDSSTGTLYISDSVNHRVMKYLLNATSGSAAAGDNGMGTNNSQLNYPGGLYFDSSSNSLIIANYGANNVVRWVLGASHWTLVAGDIGGVSGSSSTQLNGPLDVTLDSMGNVYVADCNNYRVQFFLAGQTNGTTIAGITGSSGNTAQLLDAPYSVALDSQLNLYVSDHNNHRVQKFISY
jgi:sugar lactone lactonase YvrE